MSPHWWCECADDRCQRRRIALRQADVGRAPPAASSDWKSPSACAASRTPKENGCPGTGRSAPGSPVTTTNTPSIGAALVELSRGVEIARAVAGGRRHTAGLRQHGAPIVERQRPRRVARRHVGQQRHVIAGVRRCRAPTWRAVAAGRSQLRRAEGEPRRRPPRRPRERQPAVPRVGVEQRVGGVLGLLDVGLVEWIDGEHHAGDGRRHLPAAGTLPRDRIGCRHRRWTSTARPLRAPVPRWRGRSRRRQT